jgi:hypothetical protein
VSDQTITYLILAVTVAVFIWDRLPAPISVNGSVAACSSSR